MKPITESWEINEIKELEEDQTGDGDDDDDDNDDYYSRKRGEQLEKP